MIDIMTQSIITQLHIVKKTVGIYPTGHITSKRALNQLASMLNDYFAVNGILELVAIKDQLEVNGIPCAPASLQSKDLALFMSQRGIISFEIKEPFNAEGLQTLMEVLVSIPARNHVRQLPNVMEKLSAIKGLAIRTIDLSALQFVDEDRILVNKDQDSSEFWKSLILGCLPPDKQSEHAPSISQAMKLDVPGAFSKLISQYGITNERVVVSYETVLNEQFSKKSLNPKQFDDKRTFFSSIFSTLPELPSDLKEQILTSTFKTMNDRREQEALSELLCSMPADMITAALEDARSKDMDISPSLLKLLDVLSRAWRSSDEATDASTAGLMDITYQQLQVLLDQESLETYVPEDYDDVLNAVYRDNDSNSSPDIDPLYVEDLLVEVNDIQIMKTTLTAVSSLDSRFNGYAVSLVRKLIMENEYAFVIQLMKDNLNSTDKSIILDDSTYQYLMNTYTNNTESYYPHLDQLIHWCGPSSINQLLSLYLTRNGQKGAARTRLLLQRFGDDTVTEIIKRLNTNNDKIRWSLIELLGSINSQKDLSPCMHVFENLLTSKDPNQVMSALKLIQSYQLKAIAFKLIPLVKTRHISAPQLEMNLEVLRTLESLHVQTVVPQLEVLLDVRLSLSGHRLKRTQQEISSVIRSLRKDG